MSVMMKTQYSDLHAACVSAASNALVSRKRHIFGLTTMLIVPPMVVAGLVWIMTPGDDLTANAVYAFVDVAQRL